MSTDKKRPSLKNMKEKGGQGIEGYVFKGEKIEFDAPGNILYGYVGKTAGFKDYTLFEYAGTYQIITGTSKQEWIDDPNYSGDDPKDKGYIQKGIDLYLNSSF